MPQLIAGLIALVIAFYVIVYVIIPGTMILVAVGAAWGAMHAIGNYCAALAANIRLEQPWIP